jgi:phenylacetate-CoA ligase
VVKANGDIDWDRWGEIPIVKRQDMIDHRDAMQATELPPGHESTTIATTSGTSGAPISVTSTRLAFLALNGNRYRSYRWHSIDWTDTVCALIAEEASVAAWPIGRADGPWGPAWDLDTLDGMMISINRLTPMDRLLEFLERKRPAYVTTGPTRGYALAVTARRLGASLKFSAFLPNGEAVTEQVRSAILDTFGARCIDLYSSKEAGHIAHLCPQGGGLHVNAESVLVELVDDAGTPVEPGRPGRVIITSLFNAAQPLIRYDQGDVASWGSTCTCGRNLPMLERIVGRSTTLFYHPDGRVTSSFLGLHRHLLKCEAWQIAQTGPTSFDVRYVPIDAREKGDEKALAARLREAYFADAQVNFYRVDAIPTNDFGKPREYVNEWKPLDG